MSVTLLALTSLALFIVVGLISLVIHALRSLRLPPDGAR
jgi:hypothetical protein